ncbi:hypothetical protein K7432_018529 [Basidiobolus ranarum]|uniref:Secreted protein n=1 Tax=Basidiobolus ranarum TaxID=34480 RepID=A0ABR2VIW6_9FUNG
MEFSMVFLISALVALVHILTMLRSVLISYIKDGARLFRSYKATATGATNVNAATTTSSSLFTTALAEMEPVRSHRRSPRYSKLGYHRGIGF